MSFLSGYDSEALGFDSISLDNGSEVDTSTQTSNFSETGTASQTCISMSCGSNTDITNESYEASAELAEAGKALYDSGNLNDFLKRVVPSMLEQLEQRDSEKLYNSSDSDDDEDTITAKLYQEINIKEDLTNSGTGDQVTLSVLAISWSSAGNSFAVSLGRRHHETWCEHSGIIKVFTIKRSENDQFCHSFDITEQNCITVVKYHPSTASLLAYGTTSGDLVICILQNINSANLDRELVLTSIGHDSHRVTAMQWADTYLANTFLTMLVVATKKRRNVSDHVLITSGSDGYIHVWQVNPGIKVFQNIFSYKVTGPNKEAEEITAFQFVKSYPLKPLEERETEDIFVVGCSSGQIYVCNLKNHLASGDAVDSIVNNLKGHKTCVLDLAFNYQTPGVFASISMDSELRVYDIKKLSLIKVGTYLLRWS